MRKVLKLNVMSVGLSLTYTRSGKQNFSHGFNPAPPRSILPFWGQRLQKKPDQKTLSLSKRRLLIEAEKIQFSPGYVPFMVRNFEHNSLTLGNPAKRGGERLKFKKIAK